MQDGIDKDLLVVQEQRVNPDIVVSQQRYGKAERVVFPGAAQVRREDLLRLALLAGKDGTLPELDPELFLEEVLVQVIVDVLAIVVRKYRRLPIDP